MKNIITLVIFLFSAASYSQSRGSSGQNLDKTANLENKILQNGQNLSRIKTIGKTFLPNKKNKKTSNSAATDTTQKNAAKKNTSNINSKPINQS